jgi:hypothetical protein
MFFMFSWLGALMDKTRLDLGGRERFAAILSDLRRSLGALGLSLLCLIFMVVCIVGVWWAATHPPQAHFFLNDAPAYLMRDDAAADSAAGTALESAAQTQREQVASGQDLRPHATGANAVELISSRSPQMSFQRVQSWVMRSLMDAYSFNFQNYNEQLEESRLLFRPDTYELFKSEMQGSLVKSVRKNRMIVTMTPTSSVRLIKPAEYEGRRLWMLEMKGLLYYDGAFKSKPAPQPVLFQLVVEEVPSSQTPYGLVISTIAMH